MKTRGCEIVERAGARARLSYEDEGLRKFYHEKKHFQTSNRAFWTCNRRVAYTLI